MSEIDKNKLIAAVDVSSHPRTENRTEWRTETIDDVVTHLVWQRNMTSSFIDMMKSSDVKYILTKSIRY